MGSTLFRNPRALSSALAMHWSPQSRALGFLNHVDPPSDLASNCYAVSIQGQYLIYSRVVSYLFKGVIYLRVVYNHWTGLADWTGGLV